MILVKPSFIILNYTDDAEKLIELAGRTCYKSEGRITDDSAADFVEMIRKRKHHSVLEHASATVKFIVDRGVTHELVRHRLAAYSQESTRYCDYRGEVEFVIPPWVGIRPGNWQTITELEHWFKTEKRCERDWAAGLLWCIEMLRAETAYKSLRDKGWVPQQARSVLPNSLKTEIVMTANFREWMHVFELRTSWAAHPQMREIMVPCQEEFERRWPSVFRGRS